MGALDAMKSLGAKVKTTEEVKKELGDNKGEDNTIKPPIIHVKGGDREMAVHHGLIPSAYVDVEFDVQHIKENVIAQAKSMTRKFKVRRFNSYIETLNSIMSKIRAGIKPNCSYLIGAPNGFGKTSFVTTCLKLMYARGWKAVPYVSLIELATLRAENEKNLIRGVEIKARKSDDDDDMVYSFRDPSELIKLPQVITGCYSWSEYINADILFCFLSSLDSKVIESHTLKGVLDIRGAKGLPTVVFTSTSIDPYRGDYNLREFVWDEILSYKEDVNCFDRVYHVSCYKQINNIIGDDALGIDADD